MLRGYTPHIRSRGEEKENVLNVLELCCGEGEDVVFTGLRFFTVYGPMGRPNMAYFEFADKYFSGEPIKIFNNGDFEHDLYRNFTILTM